ncbi:MAG: hypothetical protein ACFHWZ_18405 [Phycisphaerales bacterium]
MTTHGARPQHAGSAPARSQSTTHAITPSVTTTSVGIGIACQAIDAIERFGSATTGGRPSRTARGPRRSRARSAVPRRPTRAAAPSRRPIGSARANGRSGAALLDIATDQGSNSSSDASRTAKFAMGRFAPSGGRQTSQPMISAIATHHGRVPLARCSRAR